MRYVTKIFSGWRTIEEEINDWLGSIHPSDVISIHTSSAIYQDSEGGYSNIITVVIMYRIGS